MKKVLVWLLAISMIAVFSLAGCKEEAAEEETAVEEEEVAEEETTEEEVEEVDPASFEGTVEFWCFATEFENFIPKFNEIYPNITINWTNIPNEEIASKLETALGAGTGAPDVFVGEIAYVKKWVDSGVWENLSAAPYNAEELVGDTTPYVVDAGRDADGNIRGLSYQATPGGVFYRRSMAQEYFGTDDPDEIAALMSTLDGYIDMGRTINEESGGENFLLPGWQDLQWFPFNARTNPWVLDGQLMIDQPILDYFDQAKTIRDEGLDNKLAQWSAEWFAGMNGNIFSYILPTWGLFYVLDPTVNPAEPEEGVEYTSGDWAVTGGPASYFWGGTWLGIYKDSPVKDIAWEFVKYITTNKDFLKWDALTYGDYVSDLAVVEEIKDDFSWESLGGQNHYAFFYQEAPKIDSSKITKYDQEIQNMVLAAITAYVEGNLTKEEAIEQFKTDVQTAYPEVSVD
ncbi:MAG: extracellular solute-binding protein [Actinomycetota bacterium]|nr:extracellular solute-binding protein [Actinomycetota bacterium]